MKSLDSTALAPLLDSAKETSLHLPGNIHAARCGRNEVWRLTFEGSTPALYAKVWRTQAEFEIEKFGLMQAERLAAKDERFLAARCVFEDAKLGILVTEEIPGTPLATIVRDAYRLDKNPLASAERRETAHRALGLLLNWLDAFHNLPVPETGRVGYDHSVAGMAQRINAKLAQRYAGRSYAERLGLAEPIEAPSSAAPACLLFGDVSLANFYFDGSRIGAIDFEDIGVGPAARDLEVLRDQFRVAFTNLHYRGDPALLDSVPPPLGVESLIAELELRLLRFEQLTHQGGLVARARAARERRRLADLYSRLKRTSSGALLSGSAHA